ncbi:MAG TPA: HD domain-containing protein [Ktedonobacteraceae bacterium]|jgi:uncharacterized protein|nr:HD domain-containing protein [Ktedonobacteraceae bacterium]
MEILTKEAEIEAEIYDDVQRRFAGFDDPAHGWEHISRVYHLAVRIAERERADRFIAGTAALLHDIGRLSHDTTRHHAELSGALASELLSAYPITSEQKDAILHAIIAHSYSQGIEPRTLEARVVRDADRLEALGATGILRWAITATIRRTSQTRSYHPHDPFAEQRPPDDRLYMLDHFFTKLLKLADSMSTETGRAMAQQRTAFMHAYLEELRRELEL